MATHQDPEPTFEQLAEVSALADGRLAEGRRAQVEAMIAASPALRVRYQREVWVLHRLQDAQSRVRAPERLRARIEKQTQPRQMAPRRLAFGGALSAGIAAAIVAMILFLPGGAPGSPTLSRAASLAGLGASQPPPAPDPHDPTGRLAQAVDDIYFPDWAADLGWRATGQCTDRLGDHRAVTVYYQSGHRRIAYTIVSAPALNQPPDTAIQVAGLKLHVLPLHDRLLVTWRRAGKTCVLSGTDITPRQLRQLAAWTAAPGA